MCGRYKISTKAPEILAAFDAVPAELEGKSYEPPERYNVAPTDPVPVIRVDGALGEGGKRTLLPLRWGLIPFWAKDPSIGSRMINARVETLFEKSAFKEALEKRRCLVVSDGFYEWLGTGKAKQPYLVAFEDKHVFGYAGLWARWKGPAGVVETCTIITGPPNSVAAKVHDRMPMILDPVVDKDRIDAWLDPSRSVDLAELRVPRELPGLTVFPVDKRVGNVKNDDRSLAEPVSGAPPPP